MGVLLTLEDVKRGAKREDFRAGVRMRLFMPRLSVRVTRWVLANSRLSPNEITLVSFAIGLGAAAAFASTSPFVVTLGFAAFYLHVLLDYVDGEVARCRGLTSVRGAYFDLMTDRVTFPLFVFCAAVGTYRSLGEPGLLIGGFFGAFGILVDKEACDCWYRANAGNPDIEDRYMAAPERGPWRRRLGWLMLALVMSRSLPAFLAYMTAAVYLDAVEWPAPLAAVSWRGLLVSLFAWLNPLGALARFGFIYWRGAIPRRQHLL